MTQKCLNCQKMFDFSSQSSHKEHKKLCRKWYNKKKKKNKWYGIYYNTQKTRMEHLNIVKTCKFCNKYFGITANCKNHENYKCEKNPNKKKKYKGLKNTWMCRIGPQNENAQNDYHKFKEKELNGEELYWDCDYKNKGKKGQFFALIIDKENNNETLNKSSLTEKIIIRYEIDVVVTINDRDKLWKKDKYCKKETKSKTKNRKAIILKNKRIYSWDKYKNIVGYQRYPNHVEKLFDIPEECVI